jgi:crotonobetainyl-CoA:carnitine CoA-transferase CaiB-like acyl-CoA transferase
VLPTYLPVEQGAASSLGAVSLAAADLYEARTGRAQNLVVKQTASGLMTASYLYFYAQPSGEWRGTHGFDATMNAEGSVKPHRKAYPCADGRHIFLHGGFPKLKKGITDFLGCACTVEAIGAKTMEWEAEKLETAMQRKGLCATMCRTPHEWRQSPQGKVVLGLPPLVFAPRKGARGGERRALPARAARPLSDVIVIDFSHVIASPVVGRTLADHGATVIKVVSQERPRRELFDTETNHGKSPLTVELSTAEGRQRLWDLLGAADVLLDGFAFGALATSGAKSWKKRARLLRRQPLKPPQRRPPPSRPTLEPQRRATPPPPQPLIGAARKRRVGLRPRPEPQRPATPPPPQPLI